MKKNKQVLKLGDKEISFEIGNLALQTNGSVTVGCGGTVVLATVVASSRQSDLDYFPLQVECVERLYAGGRIKGSRWVKREGKPSEEAVLNARLIDRHIRPLFPAGFKNEVQLVITVLSLDHENDPADLGLLAAAAALHLSDIPWNGPVVALRVGARDDSFFINPLEQEKEAADLDLVVATGKDGVVMLEGGGAEVSEKRFIKAVEFGRQQGEIARGFLEELRKEYGRKKMDFVSAVPDQSLMERLEEIGGAKIKKLIEGVVTAKVKEEEVVGKSIFSLDELAEEAKETLGDEVRSSLIKEGLHLLFKKALRKQLLSGKRPGGRKVDEVRPLHIEIGLLPRTHGSAIFQRGLTKALSVTTLGAPSLKQLIESAEGEETKRYMHHYFMPPYAVGETGRFGWPGRREIGHGALAEKALLPLIPSEEKFPYAIRVVSEIVSSNGSTSMASVCGSTLSLMDAGVPIAAPVAGISVGLVKEGKKFTLLTDIAGIEDFNGDMDFKVAGTRKGITAVQVDIKSSGLSMEVVEGALKRAKAAREEILAEMEKVISHPRDKISRYAPKVVILHIAPGKIGGLIGPGGKTIRKIIEETECDINVEDDGTVSITGVNQEMVAKAVSEVEILTHEIEAGEEFEGTVKRLQPFGAFVEFLPGKEGLIHISRLSNGFVRHSRDVLRMGQKIRVRVREIDEMGRVNLEPTQPLSRPQR